MTNSPLPSANPAKIIPGPTIRRSGTASGMSRSRIAGNDPRGITSSGTSRSSPSGAGAGELSDDMRNLEQCNEQR